ncbi:hypothetical protein M3661_28960 [Paenibacillus sp. MER 180]|uniref:LPD38 domain-containing protein n=1 Tax=Paenibacillus sp. MER 180 TaxID=2939570 RepID=UPI00203D0ECE|nr:LPD38 domain-containing protein [Paenibacillus sp. MER 180]MCM3294131.1 hypothetical protein [Paenibacillus sp. MER 180]
MASNEEWKQHFSRAAQKANIQKYQNMYRDNAGDIGGYLERNRIIQSEQMGPEKQRWAQYFAEAKAGVNHHSESIYKAQAILPPELTSINKLEGSPILQSALAAEAKLQSEKPPTQADINRARRAEIKPSNGFEAALKSVADPVANAIDWAMYENPVGQWFSRAGHTAASMTGPTVTVKPETGSKIADVAADIAGGLAGFTANPATGNMPGTNLLDGPYKAADALMLTKLGQTAQKGASKVVEAATHLPATAQRVAEQAIRGGAAGAMQSAAQSLMRGESDADELAISTALGAGLGAAGDVAFGALGAGIRKLLQRNNVPTSEIDEILALPEPKLRLQEGQPGTVVGSNKTPQFDDATAKFEQQVIDAYKDLKRTNTGATNKELYLAAREYVSNTTSNKPIVEERIRSLRQPENPVAPLEFPKPEPIAAGNKSIQEQLAASMEELSEPLGISALGKKKTPYENASLNSTLSQLRSRSQKDFSLAGMKEKTHSLYQNLVDDVHSLNRFDKMVAKVFGRELKPSEKVHTAALNARGADMIASQIVKEGMVNRSGEVIGQSLKERLTALPLNRYAEFEDYLINRHAITRFDRGENVFHERLEWTPEKGQKILADYDRQYPMFAQVADQLYDYQRTMVQEWLVNTGMISQKQANAWFEANPYYVPNKRHFSEMEKGGKGFGSKRGYANQSVPVKKYQKTGSRRQIISPIETIIENTDAFVKAAKRNEVMQKFVTNLRKSDELSDWAEIVQSHKDNRDLNSLLDDGLEQALNEIGKDYDKAFTRTALDTDDVVRVLVNGEPVHIKIKDPDLMKAALALGPERSGWLLDQVGKLTNMFKTFTTGVNPYFVARNITRDLGDAWINTKSTGNPLNFVNDFLKASFDIMRGSKSKAWQEYKNIGGGHTSQVASRNMLQRSKQAVLPQTPVQKLKGLPRNLWRVLEDILSATESMGRLAEFKRIQGNRTPDELAKALFESQEVAINFKRRGTVTKEIDKVFPYFNAAVQGLDRFVRTFKDNPVKASVKAVLAMTVPTAALYAMNRDNPRYQELPENTKDNFFLIPTDSGEKFIKIAKPRELGMLFSSLPERLMRQFADDDPEAWNEFAETMIKTFSLPGIEGALTAKGGVPQKALGALRSTIGGPFVDIAMNQNFAGSPIVPGHLERLSPDLQYDEKTSGVARKLADAGGGSPMQYDYIMKQYLGGLGKAILPGATPSGNPLEALVDQFISDPTYSNQLSTQFYEIKKKLDQAYDDRNVRGELPEWYHDGARKRMNKLSESMSDTRKRMKEIEADDTLSRQEKEAQTRELREQVNELARMGLDLVKELNIKPD